MISSKQMNASSPARGFTLIEILLVVAIIGVIAAIAIPSYQGSVIRSTRSVATAALMDLANRQEQFYLNNRTYTDNLSNLGYTNVFDSGGDSATALNRNQGSVTSSDSSRVYYLKIDSASTTAYSISAVPQMGQADDTECATLSLTNTGARTESGTGSTSDCW